MVQVLEGKGKFTDKLMELSRIIQAGTASKKRIWQLTDAAARSVFYVYKKVFYVNGVHLREFISLL